MFKAIKETDNKFKTQQTHYYLTQGDSCKITSTPYKGGEVLKSGISKCTFKLADSNYSKKLEKTVTVATGDAYVFTLSSDDTKTLTPGQYVYEIEYTMTDNSVQTPNSWKFDILPQING